MSQNPYAPPPGNLPPPRPDVPPPAVPVGAPGYPPPPPYPAYGPGRPEVGPAFSWAWTMFTRQAAPFLLAGVIYSVVVVVAVLLAWLGVVAGMFAAVGIGSAAESSDSAGGVVGVAALLLAMAGYTVVIVLVVLAGYLFQAGMARAALTVSLGHRVEPATFFRFERCGTIVGAALLVGLGTTVGAMLCVLPGLAVAWLTQFTFFFLIDKGLGAVDAIRASIRLVRDNTGVTALLCLVVVAIGWVGGSSGVGALLGVPLSVLVTAYLYRTLLREPIAY